MPGLTSRRWFLMGSLLALTACGSGPPARPSFADIRFTNVPPIRLDVAVIEVVDGYPPQFDAPHVEEQLPIPLPHVADSWARDRLQAAGRQGRAVATVTDASVVEIRLPKEGGLTGTFTKQEDTRYEARVSIRVEAQDGSGLTRRTAQALAERSLTIIEGATPNERDRMLYHMETELIADLDRQLETDIRANFGSLVR